MGRKGRSGARPKYHFGTIRPGGQRVISGESPANVRAALSMWKRAHGGAFRTRTVECELIVERLP